MEITQVKYQEESTHIPLEKEGFFQDIPQRHPFESFLVIPDHLDPVLFLVAKILQNTMMIISRLR